MAICIGVHIGLIIGAIDRGIGGHADAGDGVAEVILHGAGDLIGSENGGEILQHGLSGIDIAV